MSVMSSRVEMINIKIIVIIHPRGKKQIITSLLDGLFYTANFSAQYETKTFNLNLRILTFSYYWEKFKFPTVRNTEEASERRRRTKA